MLPRSKLKQTPPDQAVRLFTGYDLIPAGRTASGDLNEWVVSLTIDGCCDYHIGNDRILLQKHDALLLRPHAIQHWRVPPAPANPTPDSPPGYWRILYATFLPPSDWLAWMDLPIGSEGYFRMNLKDASVARRRMTAAMLKAHRLFRDAQSRPSGVPVHRELILHSVGEAVLWMRAGATQPSQPLDERVTRAVEFMNKSMDSPLSLEHVSDAALASRSQLSLLFVRELGVSPMHYLEQIRMERAKQMLRLTPYPIKHIARSVGFEDPKYFVKRFRLGAGTTPRRFRNQGT